MKINSPVTNNEVQMEDGKPIISKTDLKGKILSINRAFLDISGFTNDELIGQPHNIVRHPDTPSAAFEDMWEHLKAGNPWRGMVKNRCKNGDYYWVEANATPVRKNGQVVEYMSVRRKPTAQQISEAEILYAKLNTVGVQKQGWLGRIKNKISSASLMMNYVYMVMALLTPILLISYGIELVLPPMYAGLVSAAAAILMVLAGTAWFLSKRITQPLNEVANWMANIAEGQYDNKIVLDRTDEIGLMMKNMQTSQLRLDYEIEEMKFEAEQATRISQALQVCNTNVMMADSDCNIIYMNKSVDEMMQGVEADLQTDLPNFKAANLIGENIDVFHKNPAHQRNLLGNLTSSYQAKIVAGGRNFRLIATPVFSDEKERLGTVIEWEDQTDMLARMSEEKRISEENLRIKQALDSVSTNAIIVSPKGSVLYCNDAFIDMMTVAETDMRREIPDFHVNQLMGSSIEVFDLHREFTVAFLEGLNKTYASEIVMGGRNFSITMSPIINDQDEKAGIVIEWVDRTLEVGVEQEVDALVEAASSGDLSKRIGIDGKDGFFLNLARGLNNLVEVSDAVVNDTARVLSALAKGHLTEKISNDYQGDFDKLKQDANTTVDQLTDIITNIREAASTVSTGANEIAQGNADLSQRTEAQASNLEETASSMEEMTSAVKQTSDNASHANELASSASELAETGGNVVNKAVTAMEEINQASSKIADIIGVIDEIAFQTNLLALNAAVEAARAGEQGRGFAVVAGEVRNLAQRSAGAAKEIKDLIRDSVDKVEAGTELVNNSGKTLEQIVGSVKKVTEMISEISTASNEQSSGIDQVNSAVAQMDEMTQQNAALVEEATAAGEAMAEQSRSMMKLMDFFTTSDVAVTSSGGSPRAAMSPVVSSSAVQSVESTISISDDDEWHEF